MTDHDSLHAALAAVQADLPTIGKAHTADTGKYSYAYASLNDVNRALLPLLSEHGLTWACLPDADGRVVGLLTHAPSGETLESSWPLPKTTDPQALGSALTYSRRYLLTAVVGSAPDEDDDGAAAQRAPSGPTPDSIRTRIYEMGEWVHPKVAEWLAERQAEKVQELDVDGLVALDVQLDAWQEDA